MSALRGQWLRAPPVDVALSTVTPWSLYPAWYRSHFHCRSQYWRSEKVVSKEQIQLPKTDPLCCLPGLPSPARAGSLQDQSPTQPLFVCKSKGGGEGSPRSPSQLFTSLLYLVFSRQIQVTCIVLVPLQLLAGKGCWEEAGAPQISFSQQWAEETHSLLQS